MNDAVYVSSVDKIFGTVGPYVCMYNATTGAREGFVRVASPLYGDMRICYNSNHGSLYVSAYNQPNQQYFGNFFPTNEFPNREVFPVSTGLAVGASLGLWNVFDNHPPYGGFQWIASAGDYIYVTCSFTTAPSEYVMLRVNPTNIADRNAQAVSSGFRPEHGALTPTQIILPNSFAVTQVKWAPILFNLNGDWSDESIAPHEPCSCEYCASNGLIYMVCGNTNLVRINVLSPINFTALNIGSVEATADPCRIRYRSFDQKLYLPCMTSNTVIVWDPATETGIAKTGFENPVDCIFTGSKAWAVQNAPIGLKEIT